MVLYIETVMANDGTSISNKRSEVMDNMPETFSCVTHGL